MRSSKAAVYDNGITEGVIWQQLLKFFFPIVLGTFFQQMYNTVDAVVVGNFVGKEALAAVGGTTAVLINLLVGFFVGLSSGATVVISQQYGAKDTDGVSRSVHTAIAMALLGGVFLLVAGYLFTPLGLHIMNTPDDVLADARTYMRIYFVGVIFLLIYNIGSGILRAIGDSKRPLYVLIVCCLCNVALDLLFVCVFHMGVAGAAIATIATEGVSSVIILIMLARSNDCYRLNLKKIRIDRSLLGDILRIGFPAGLQSMMYSISNVFIQANVNSFGTNVAAGWTAYGKIDSFFWMVMDAFGISITTFSGQNIGARKLDRVHKGVRSCAAMAFGFSFAFSGLLYLMGDKIVSLFTNEGDVVAAAMEMMRCAYPYFFTYVLICVLSGAMRGAGDSLVPMLMIAGGICLFRIVWIEVAHWMGAYVTTMIYSYPTSWAFTSVLFVIYYKRGKWLEHARALQC